jgi:predicted ATP-dependent serine protease
MKIEKREVKVERRGRPAKVKNLIPVPSVIDFSQITRLNKLNIDKRMLESMPIGVSSLDKLFSHEGGLPCSTNIMAIGDPGVGKTSVMLDIMASIQNKGRKCLFISGKWDVNKCSNILKDLSNLGL